MTTWTREELEAVFPVGSVNVQVDDDVRPLDADEWAEWIGSQVGMAKPTEDLEP